MKKLAIVIVLAVVGGGAYMYFQKPEQFKEITSQVTNKVESLIAGSNWLKLKNYSKEFTKKGLEEIDEKEGYVGKLKEKFTINEFSDSDTGTLLLANDGAEAHALYFTYSETADGDIVKISKEQWAHFFEKEVEFLESGEAESEHAIGTWETVDGNINILIHRKDAEVLPPVKEMAEETQTAISQFTTLVKEKVDMEKRWVKLGDEKHFCFDSNRFKEIVSEMDGLKKHAEELTKKAKELMAKMPQAQVAIIRREFDGASFE